MYLHICDSFMSEDIKKILKNNQGIKNKAQDVKKKTRVAKQF